LDNSGNDERRANLPDKSAQRIEVDEFHAAIISGQTPFASAARPCPCEKFGGGGPSMPFTARA